MQYKPKILKLKSDIHGAAISAPATVFARIKDRQVVLYVITEGSLHELKPPGSSCQEESNRR